MNLHRSAVMLLVLSLFIGVFIVAAAPPTPPPTPGGNPDCQPTAERCDNVDNDCDTTIDEGCDDDADGYPDNSMSCLTQFLGGDGLVHACGTVPDCNDNNAAIKPGATELCDNVNNDCDATIDEGCDDDSDNYCDSAMACVTQFRSGSGTVVACSAQICNDCNDNNAAIKPGATELCDGIDNNCVSGADEGCACISGQTQACGPASEVGICKRGTQTCGTNGQWGACTGAVYAGTEVCDQAALDEDCDGSSNENCACASGQTQACGPASEVGICKRGTQTCTTAGTWGDCLGAVNPATETCNSLDDDCDGLTDAADSSLVLLDASKTQGVCAGAKKRCVGGQWLEPDYTLIPRYAAVEQGTNFLLCDLLDNDCDGAVDESITQPMTCGLGACAGTPGTRSCTSGTITENCNALLGATTEVCDQASVDEDCDGSNNEGCTCTSGQTQACGPASEVGICKKGIQTCGTNGQWGACTGAVYAGTEVCDQAALDEDCDGSSNENCACASGQTQACGPASEVGICKRGTQMCGTNGQWGACTGAVNPTNEVCNGQDDDCDGLTDAADSSMTNISADNQFGVCAGAKKRCVGGQWLEPDYTLIPRYAAVEQGNNSLLCDLFDNDCDGQIDEFITLPMTCGLGACAGSTGTKNCTGGTWAENCNALFGASKELCDENEVDEDCDGSKNEGCACGTVDDLQQCGQTDLGVCAYGFKKCQANGTWSECQGAVYPTKSVDDTCNGLDDDCDGVVDDDLVPPLASKQQGVCAGLTKVCTESSGAISWQEPVYSAILNYAAVEEGNPLLCDGLDNDCDGELDEQCGSGGNDSKDGSQGLTWTKDGSAVSTTIVDAASPLREISGTLEGGSSVDGGDFSVETAKGLLPLPLPEGYELYRYITFSDDLQGASFSMLSLSFAVGTSWLSTLGASRGDVALFFLNDGEWQKATVTFTDSTPLYTATLTGASLQQMAIAAKKPVGVTPPPVDEGKGLPGWLIAIIIIAVLGALCGVGFLVLQQTGRWDEVQERIEGLLGKHEPPPTQKPAATQPAQEPPSQQPVQQQPAQEFAQPEEEPQQHVVYGLRGRSLPWSEAAKVTGGSRLTVLEQQLEPKTLMPAVDPALKPLYEYVVRMEAQGYGEEAIRQALVKAGWRDELVEQVLHRQTS